MAELKTKENDASVEAYLDGLEDEGKRNDSRRVLAAMREVTGADAKMWGGSIIGFGRYHFRYASGREGDWFLVGFAPRKRNITLYIMPGFASYGDLMTRLGKHKTGKSCLYINKLDDIDFDVLRELLAASVAHMRDTYPDT